MSIKFGQNTAEWIKDWTSWTVALLIPEWDVSVEVVDKLSELEKEAKEIYGENADILAHSNPSNDSIFTKIELLSNLKDDEDGHLVVVHEICHAFTAYMSQMAENLITNKSVRKSAWKSFSDAEEQTVVKLSRIVVALREQIMLNSVNNGEKTNEGKY